MSTVLTDEKFGFDIQANDMLQLFSQQSGWDNKYRQIIVLAKQLNGLPDLFKTDEHLIDGCESATWLVTREIQGHWHFYADSEARIVKGLLALVLAAFNGKSSQQIQDFDIHHYFATLGLTKQLSPSRSNGLVAVVEAIKTLTC
ncbi:cysteine desulfurase sulfur acceptor subunit CsdE [Motilimonas pumila]|uniref:Cysteine desulfurase sulfur acceptor subunit CsdE n=1 Tax=Motilimonas pumila TaxID=2303987 RepID=A0A418YJG7_9GAMM|nr:cysteine desulfurase sulfur acceptor subunit CsdE [Motilimonas pumila]RJG50624.1 cysteine desulfurase sulfur acceptor subunit CsdE [Motilimonas pumila]